MIKVSPTENSFLTHAGSHINLSADNFIHALDTGTILCQICLKIEQQASKCVHQGTYTQVYKSLSQFICTILTFSFTAFEVAKDFFIVCFYLLYPVI